MKSYKKTTIKSISLVLLAISSAIFVNEASAQSVGINTTTPKSTFEVSGSVGQTITTVTGNTTLTVAHSIVACNNGAVAITITLPLASGCKGRVYTIQRFQNSTAMVTIARTSTDLISGATSLMLMNPAESVMLVSDGGTDWRKLSSNNSSSNSAVMYPMGEISYFSTTGTSITFPGISDGASTNLSLAAPTTAFVNFSDFDNGGSNNGRLRYIGTTAKTFHVACTISVSPSSSNDIHVIGIAKNGTIIASSRVLQKLGTSADTQSTALHVAVSLTTNDYLQLVMGNMSTTGSVTLKTFNLFALGM